jgi:hypothetical protein
MSGKKDNTKTIAGVILGIFIVSIIIFLIYYYRNQIFSSNATPSIIGSASTPTSPTTQTTAPQTTAQTTAQTTTQTTAPQTTPQTTTQTTAPQTSVSSDSISSVPKYIKNRLYGFGRYNPDSLTNGINLSKVDRLTEDENKLFADIDIGTVNGTLSYCFDKCSDNDLCRGFTRSNIVNDNDSADCYLKKIPSFKDSDGNSTIISNTINSPYNSWIKTFSNNPTIRLKNANGEIVTITNNSDTSKTNEKFYIKNKKYGFGLGDKPPFNNIDISSFAGMVSQCKKKCSETKDCNGFTRPNNVDDNDDKALCFFKKIPTTSNESMFEFISNQTDKPFNSWIGTNTYPVKIIDENNKLQIVY